MKTEEDNTCQEELPRVSSGPLRLTEEAGKLFVVGFGLRLPVKDQEEGRQLIAELEDQGYRICL